MIRSNTPAKRTALIDEIRILRPQGQTRAELEQMSIFILNGRLDAIRAEDRRAMREAALRAQAQAVGGA